MVVMNELIMYVVAKIHFEIEYFQHRVLMYNVDKYHFHFFENRKEKLIDLKYQFFIFVNKKSLFIHRTSK